ncbi:MAG TPA: class I SAM-dependent methyltransferase [Ramlibacter sp.]|nr:class I SAM-dependent methyltransferase [Ramlibacter sp.]
MIDGLDQHDTEANEAPGKAQTQSSRCHQGASAALFLHRRLTGFSGKTRIRKLKLIDSNATGFIGRHYDVFYQELVGPLQPLAQFDARTGLNWASGLGCTSFIRKDDCRRHCKVLDCALRRPGSKLIVELGCGLGGYGVHLARRFDADLLGIDVSTVAVRLAQDEAAKSDIAERLRFKKANIERTGLPSGCAAAIVAIDSIYLLRNRPAVASEITRLLRPGGILIATMFETMPVPGRKPTWEDAFSRHGFKVAARRDVTRSWRTYMLGKHTLRWQSRELLREQCGPDVEPHLDLSRSIVESAGECLAHLKRWELCLQRPAGNPVGNGRPGRSNSSPPRRPPRTPAPPPSSSGGGCG